MNDDEFARAMRRLDPARTPVDAPIPLDAERRVREIVGRPRVGRPRATARRRPLLAWTSAAAAIVVILTIVTGVLWMPAPSASALTPTPLVYTSAPADPAEAIDTARAQLARDDDGVVAERRSLSLGWYFSASPDGAEATVFRREWVDLRWNEDFSGSIVTTAAEATNADGDTVPAGEPTPGTVVAESRYVQNQFRPLSPTPPTPSVDAMRELLRTSVGADGEMSAGDVINGARTLLGEWTLDDAQQSALLQVVAEAPGLRALGTTRDRIGREVIGLGGIPSLQTNADVTLLISADTGRIVGFESALVDANTDLDLPPGSLTEYALWDVRDREDAPR
ncbi:hypothetical protein [uncultured Microbacterium sp.]|uniref:hypothetical protein n=1 Tax=uncultured Microbacterium sp. TaxID=191216 RepID=UPI0025DF1AF6|nr:hypothetical protein [uncultured Microbacterium sp.]